MNDYSDYKERKYLSSTEAARYLDISVGMLHNLVRVNKIKCFIAGSGQKRFNLKNLKKYETSKPNKKVKEKKKEILIENIVNINNTTQKIFIKNAMDMSELKDDSVHLMITSPPYFDAKMYTKKPIKNDLGNIHNLDEWFKKIGIVWKEVFRVLQPGRKAFINIMNLPIRDNGGFKSLNLVGRTIDTMEKIGFIFKRDIVWHKTNGVRANFGTYPYPGGILINNMHEFVLEFNKPNKKGFNKYGHLTKEQKEASRLDKEFWLSIKNTDVWLMKPRNSGDSRTHVAPFPYELPYRIIKAFTFIGEVVLDPFLGSGTSLEVAADLKRNGIGYEIVPEIAETAIKNLNQHQNKLFT
ncbi:site-specific DNA-methyltransferase [Candidatus Shapirobacteria bacterium]|nr:site-specific DNA-methyltransferase [Candidatus Shapirobacteria bacterium]